MPKGKVVIPAQYDGYTVSKLGVGLFWRNNDIEQIVLPSTVSVIDSAFNECKKLYSATLPEGLKEIVPSAFRGCGLKSVVLPESLAKVGSWAFAENTALETAIIKGKTEFEERTFSGCTNLTTVEFHNAIQTLPDYMFAGCVKIQSIQLPMKLKQIGNNCFLSCSQMDNVQLPDTVQEIGEYAFRSCNSLRSIKIPDGVTEIKKGTFTFCSNLAEVKLPARMTKIGERAFDFTGLRKIALMEGISEIAENTFGSCQSLQEIYIPVSVKKIGAGAFFDCYRLKTVYFGGGEEMWKNIVIDMEKINGDAGNKYLIRAEYYWNQTPAAIGI